VERPIQYETAKRYREKQGRKEERFQMHRSHLAGGQGGILGGNEGAVAKINAGKYRSRICRARDARCIAVDVFVLSGLAGDTRVAVGSRVALLLLARERGRDRERKEREGEKGEGEGEGRGREIGRGRGRALKHA